MKKVAEEARLAKESGETDNTKAMKKRRTIVNPTPWSLDASY